MTTADPLPGSDGSVLDPGGMERAAEQVVTRQALYKPKDEVPPPEGSGQNWFEYNYRPRPAALSLRLQIDPKPLSDALHPFVEASDMEGFLKTLRGCQLKVEAQPGNPIVTLRLLP